MIAASETHELLLAAVVTGAFTLIGVLVTVVIAWSNHRTGRGINEQVRPENGMRLGELVEQVSQTVEATNGHVHEVSKRVDRVENRLDSHTEETSPLIVKFKEMLEERKGT